jgi:putative acetyltransferase
VATIALPRGIAIRAATPGDAPFIQRVHEDSIRGLGTRAYSRTEVESWAAGLRPDRYVAAMTSGGESFLLAEHRSGVVGFCSFGADEIVGLYVAPAQAGRGIGAALLRAAEQRIGAAGRRAIRIGASLNAQRFYEAHGYTVVERRTWRSRGGLGIAVVDLVKPPGRRSKPR